MRVHKAQHISFITVTAILILFQEKSLYATLIQCLAAVKTQPENAYIIVARELKTYLSLCEAEQCMDEVFGNYNN